MRHPLRFVLCRHPLLAYFGLGFLISWTAVLFLIAPSGIPGTGADYVSRGPLVFSPCCWVRVWRAWD
jgi:hypothetical protein